MARTTPELVGAIIEVDAEIGIQPFIDAANDLVSEVCGESVYPDLPDRPTRIETWLAAHFYAIRDPRNQSEQAQGVGRTIESRVDLGFNVTRYGQMALRLDTAGGLAALEAAVKAGRKVTPSIAWLGTKASEESEFE